MQSRRTLAHPDPAPLSTQSLPGRMDSLVHLLVAGFGDMPDHRPVRGIHIRKLAFPVHEAAIDIVLD